MKIIHCGQLFTPTPEPTRTCLAVADGRIVALMTLAEAQAVPDAQWVDLSACLVGPGLVDVHCHGAMGSDFADGTVADVTKAAAYHLRHGTTTLLAGIGSCSLPEMLAACQAVREVKQHNPALWGVHLEGPYFNPNWYGCHLHEMIRPPTPAETDRLFAERDLIRFWTLAPELPGALDLIRRFTPHGTVFAIGHSEATWDQIQLAIAAGLRHSTHIFCAMPHASRVDLVLQPGVLESVLMDDRLTTEIIGDGIHVGPRLIEFVHKIKGGARTAFVSDALRGVGCPPGEYAFGPRQGQLCRLLDQPRVGVVPGKPGVLASSAIVLADSLRLVDSCALSLSQLWEMASLTPAYILGCADRKGALRPGLDADLLALDEQLEVKAVFSGGELVP